MRDDKGKPVAAIFSYWFAWQAFYPKTAVYKGSDRFHFLYVLTEKRESQKREQTPKAGVLHFYLV